MDWTEQMTKGSRMARPRRRCHEFQPVPSAPSVQSAVPFQCSRDLTTDNTDFTDEEPIDDALITTID
jgi:hypothetical protein